MSNLFDEPQHTSEEPSDSCSPLSKKIKKDCGSPSKNVGHWTTQEHDAYLSFLEKNQACKKNIKIFKPMSDMIGTRSPSQCRSHHQKFNPMSPQVAKKQANRQRKLTHSTSNEVPMQLEDVSSGFEIRLRQYDENDLQPPERSIDKLFDFNLDDQYM